MIESDGHPADKTEIIPDGESVRSYLLYSLSIPERTLRSTAAMLGGVVHESATMLIPQAFRDSRSYQTFVQQMLDLVANDIGGVRPTGNNLDLETGESKVENYVARKTVGSFIDFAGMATLHLSPVLVLAVVSDIAYGSNAYLKQLSQELKSEGIIPADSTINHASDLLDAIGQATGDVAEAMDTPPISLEGLKQTITDTTTNMSRVDPGAIIPKSEIDRLWTDMNQVASEEDTSLLNLSTALTIYTLNQVETVRQGALTTIRISGNLMDQHIFQHYANGIEKVSEQGLFPMLAECSQPYIAAVWENYSINKTTITEELISGKLFGKWISGINAGILGTEKSDRKS